MNREILFRGKRVDNGEWVEGYYAPLGNKYHYILTGRLNIIKSVPTFDHFEVFPETVGQYTGLTDKNGVKIFEGDIIKGKGKNVYAVEYGQNIAGYISRGFGVLSYPCMNIGTMKYYEVIGNIHDNPELLNPAGEDGEEYEC